MIQFLKPHHVSLLTTNRAKEGKFKIVERARRARVCVPQHRANVISLIGREKFVRDELTDVETDDNDKLNMIIILLYV